MEQLANQELNFNPKPRPNAERVRLFFQKKNKERKRQKKEEIIESQNKVDTCLNTTVILLIYGIELGIRVLTADGKAEYLIVVIILILLLMIANLRFYGNYKNEK